MKKNICFQINIETKKKLDKYARKTGMKKQNIIEEAITDYLIKNKRETHQPPKKNS